MDIHKIIDTVEQNTSSIQNVGLLNGKAGAMTLFFCYHSFSHQQKYEDLAFQYLEDIYERINIATLLSYADGLCGFGTAIEFLLQNNLVAGNGNEILEDIDRKVANHIIHLPVSDCSLDQGLTGWGRYLLYRIKGEKSDLDSVITLHAKEYFIQVIDLIDYCKEENRHVREEVISLLIDAHPLNIINFKVEKLLRFFLSVKNDNPLFLQNALKIKETRTTMYLNELRIKVKTQNDTSYTTGMRDGYTGMGMTWLMDRGYILKDWIDLI
jgi:hypothetical protein